MEVARSVPLQRITDPFLSNGLFSTRSHGVADVSHDEDGDVLILSSVAFKRGWLPCGCGDDGSVFDGSVFYLSNHSHVCISANSLQVMSPGLFGVVSNSVVDGGQVSSNCLREVFSLLQFHPPRRLGSFTDAISVSFHLIVSCSSC